MASLSYLCLVQEVILAFCFVQFTVSEVHTRTVCYFYPIHGVLNSHDFEIQQVHSVHVSTIFGKRSHINVLQCQYTGYQRIVDGRLDVLVSCPNHGGHYYLAVDVTAGHCGSHDCCHSGQPKYNYCAPNPCHNGGRCSNGNTGYRCHCLTGSHGSRCEYDCANNPCMHGLCSNKLTGYMCTCDVGYKGHHCNEHLFIHTTTKRSTKALLTTTHRSTLALLTTTHRRTQMIPTATSKLCMDDQFFNCQNPVICKSEFRNNCPLSCGICVPEPTTTKKPCIDNILLNCQDHSICLSKLSQHCPATCGMCVVSGSVFKGAVPILNLANPHHYLPETTQGTIARGAVQHTCNKIGLLMDLAMGKSLHQQSAKGCGGNSSDAVVIKHCQAPSFSKWRKGFEVTSNCSHINHYTPVAEWDSQGFTDNIGVITFCHSGVIEMITQTCGGNILLRNITTPASKSFYTVDWV
ncbi:uncharacterized protein LOC143057099 isoform X3 [Mytilus galloprovincialis]|uniref:uncharacterized protein LOC143057099 isoform X3 n=1 Tax=Mytilus galloprovincialis TaxID=29158 RepID=UPI003F7C9054